MGVKLRGFFNGKFQYFHMTSDPTEEENRALEEFYHNCERGFSKDSSANRLSFIHRILKVLKINK